MNPLSRPERALKPGVALSHEHVVGCGPGESDSPQGGRELHHANKLQTLGLLAGGITHDFNNLLTAILGNCDLAIPLLDPASPVRRHILEIRSSGERAAGLTRQILAFTRRQVAEPRAFDLNARITDLERLLGRVIGEDVHFDTFLAKEPQWILADPGQIDQVILNMVVNARDAMPQGGDLTLTTSTMALGEDGVRGRNGIRPGSFVVLTIRDTGCGMDEDTLALIFEPFFTTKEAGKGTGLGLAMACGVVAQAGGFIAVESRLGAGTTFGIHLPVAKEAAPTAQAAAHPGETPRGCETILLAEDEEPVRTLVVQILEMGGYRVLAARDGGEALELAITYPAPIALLVTDLVLPGPGGPQLALALLAARPDLRVLYMSGYPSGAETQDLMRRQKAEFLQKPFSVDALLRKVREILDPT